MKRSLVRFLSAGGVGAALALLATAALAAHSGGNVPLKGYDGAVLAVGSTAPYSPKQTCGGCHDYDRITQGYHFQQGFDELIADAERTAGEKPFIKSPGMYGKW